MSSKVWTWGIVFAVLLVVHAQTIDCPMAEELRSAPISIVAVAVHFFVLLTTELQWLDRRLLLRSFLILGDQSPYEIVDQIDRSPADYAPLVADSPEIAASCSLDLLFHIESGGSIAADLSDGALAAIAMAWSAAVAVGALPQPHLPIHQILHRLVLPGMQRLRLASSL